MAHTRVTFPSEFAVLDADFKVYAKRSNSKRRLKVVSRKTGTIYRSIKQAKVGFDVLGRLAEAEESVVQLRDDLETCQELCGQLVRSENNKMEKIESLEAEAENVRNTSP